MSHEIQNEILEFLGHQILTAIIRDVLSSNWFSIIADEATDAALVEQVCILLTPINPRRACAARVTVLGSVCLSVKSHLTYGASVRPENAVTYSAGNEGQKICGDLPETTAFKSYAAKHERKSQYANFLTRSAFSA